MTMKGEYEKATISGSVPCPAHHGHILHIINLFTLISDTKKKAVPHRYPVPGCHIVRNPINVHRKHPQTLSPGPWSRNDDCGQSHHEA